MKRNNRELTVGVRLTPSEVARVDKQIARSGIKRATYLRMALLEKLAEDEATAAGQPPRGA